MIKENPFEEKDSATVIKKNENTNKEHKIIIKNVKTLCRKNKRKIQQKLK